MNRSSYLVLAMLLIAGCAENSFKKSPDGAEYRIVKNESGRKALKGNFIQFNKVVRYKDSVLFSSSDGMPMMMPYDTAQLPLFYRTINEGDSLVLRISTDTLIKMGQSAPFMKKHEYLYQSFKFVKVYASREEAEKVANTFRDAAKAKAYQKTSDLITKELADSAAQVKKDDQLIADYLRKNNITATKTRWGTYVSIETPGTGENLTDTSIAAVNYTGRTLKDSVFDSNTDSKFGHNEPYDVDMSEFSVIPGWIDGLKLMKKGSKGKFIIPSILAYGKRGSGKVGPDENLVFDIEIANVVTRDQYEEKRAEMMRQQQMQQQMQQRMMQQMQEQMKQRNSKQQPPQPEQKK